MLYTHVFMPLSLIGTKGHLAVGTGLPAGANLPPGANGSSLHANSAVSRGVDYYNTSPFSVPFASLHQADAVWTNQPAAVDFLCGSFRNVIKADVAGFTHVRLVGVKRTVAANAGAKLYLRYHTSFTTTAATYAAIGVSSTDCEVAIDVTDSYLDSGWVELISGARADVFLALVGDGGDGVIDPQFGNLSAQFMRR